jgi:hypothetical protein
MTLGVGASLGGAALLILTGLSHGLLGAIVGGAVVILGSVLAGSRQDRSAGLVVAGIGMVACISSFTHLGWLILLSGVGLLSGGIVALIRSIRSLRRRM